MQIGNEPTLSLFGRAVTEAVSPFAKQRLDDALHLSVRLRSVGTDTKMANVHRLTKVTEAVGDERGAVVAHDAFDGDTVPGEPGDGVRNEYHCRRGAFVGKDLGVRDTRGVICGHMDELEPPFA